jgi:hypothetical protein
MFPKYSNWVTIKWTKESAESIIRKYQEVVEQLDGQEAPPILDIFKNIVFIKSAINCMGLFIVHHLHSWLIPNSPALRIKVLSA